jgi:splicing factor 3B subunit 1
MVMEGISKILETPNGS